MSLSNHLAGYLEQRGAQYGVCGHAYSRSSAETARAANIMPNLLAKSVILEDEDGCVMAVIPADKTVMIGELARLLGRRSLRLSDENRIATLLSDCDRGAVPSVGMAWGIETVIDDELEENSVVYVEGGDHEHLLRMSHDEFHTLMRGLRHGCFSKLPTH
ncbi:MAG: YbaK/EbsC family protein [Burkholderiaceae bacterium]